MCPIVKIIMTVAIFEILTKERKKNHEKDEEENDIKYWFQNLNNLSSHSTQLKKKDLK